MAITAHNYLGPHITFLLKPDNKWFSHFLTHEVSRNVSSNDQTGWAAFQRLTMSSLSQFYDRNCRKQWREGRWESKSMPKSLSEFQMALCKLRLSITRVATTKILRDIIKMWNVSSLLPIYIQTCEASVACVISLIRSWKESSVSKLMADQSNIWWIWMNDLASERTINKRLIYQETQKSHNIAIKTNCLNSWSRIRVHGRCKRWICMRHAWWTGSWL